MNKSDMALIKCEDIWVALGLLTRLPLPDRTWNEARPAAMAAWAYPVTGLIVGGIACAIACILIALGLPSGMVAAAVLLCLSLLTGAMHEDGLADTADGLWGGTTVERRLEIMKDSHIGAYGVIALIAGFAMRWSALTALLTAGWIWGPIIVAAMTSRQVMSYVMGALPNARDTGLSNLTGRPCGKAPIVGAAPCLIVILLAFGISGLLLAFIAAISAFMCIAIARAKIGGQTGDILGATQLVTEIAILGAIAALVL
ncbi:MAG: adenosylcobinamide-GDP ribazoletransferase [Litoreibacter sp.]|uniref:adenosylcobinamide-GDP ribazoletransferase n=1 Tax=Litoreibacter sp. TaxID=1969459 RepID=UPI00329A0432